MNAKGPFTLPELPWNEGALDPVISARTIGLHYGKHHRAYVDKLNELVGGTPLADIFSLGKVLYEASTGLDREQFPSLPTSLLESPGPGFAELNQVVLKACEVNPAERYQSAAEFRVKLEELREKFEGREKPDNKPGC